MTNFSVAANDASPAVMYATIPISPDSRNSAKRREIRDGRCDSVSMLELNRLAPSADYSRWKARVLQTRDKHKASAANCNQDLSPSTREYVAMSLSPRPDMLTMTRSLAVR